jgi:hypothetical protein
VILTHQRIGAIPSLRFVLARLTAAGGAMAAAIELTPIVTRAKVKEARAAPASHLPKAVVVIHRAIGTRQKLASMLAPRQATPVVAPASTEGPRLEPRVLASLSHPLRVRIFAGSQAGASFTALAGWSASTVRKSRNLIAVHKMLAALIRRR